MARRLLSQQLEFNRNGRRLVVSQEASSRYFLKTDERHDAGK